jgi:hypothetical protein
MTDKDPEDMTASELLRSGNSICGLCMMLTDGDCINHGCLDIFTTLANKIDAEIVKAYSEKLNTCAMRWAKANGWPDFREGEDFGAWLDRCALPRPRFEDGEPVQFGEEVELHYKSGGCDKGRFQEIKYNKGSVWILSFTGVDHASEYRYDSERDTIKRPAPEALGADGKPIVEGETVYRLSDGTAWKVTKLHHSEHRISVVSVGGKGVTAGGRFLTSEYTHTLPETQERIDDDATMHPAAYCAAYGIDLGDDPDREKSTTSMIADLLRRQREYDKRKGGAE